MGRVLLNAFILFHIVSILCWSLPTQPRIVRAYNRLVKPYMLGSGLWQGWNMFAPDPLAIDIDVDAQLVFRDGSRKTWVFPRMEEMGYWERYRKERYRKWRERVRLDAFAVVWPDTARYIARLHQSPENPVVTVKLTRYWTAIPAPSGDWLPSRTPRVAMTDRHEFFSYRVEPGDPP